MCTTAIRSSSWPNDPPTSAVKKLASIKNTSNGSHASQPCPLITADPPTAVATSSEANQSTNSAAIRRPQPATLPRPSGGSPSRSPGYVDGADGELTPSRYPHP